MLPEKGDREGAGKQRAGAKTLISQARAAARSDNLSDQRGRMAIERQLDNLRGRLQTIRRRNELAAGDKKLSLQELALDLKLMRELKQRGAAAAEAEALRIKRENLGNQLIWHRIKQQ